MCSPWWRRIRVYIEDAALVAGATALVAAGAITAVATAGPAQAAVGCQVTYAVTAQWSGGFTANVNLTSGITIVNDSSRATVICRKYNGNNTGDEPTQVGTGADSTDCLYSSSDLTYRRHALVGAD